MKICNLAILISLGLNGLTLAVAQTPSPYQENTGSNLKA